ncbi:diadenylate cyclase CdaA, partial [Candidatus Margulisiibacteriota bacterium]
LLQKMITVIVIFFVVIFQPELRQALERIGRGKLFTGGRGLPDQKRTAFLKQLFYALNHLSKRKVGALIVLERETGLGEFIETGTVIDSFLSSELLVSMFYKTTPLHDGAVIVQGNRIAAARCLLPLSDSKTLDKRLGTRHRAAAGLTEQTDAIALVVSEETGFVSIVENGIVSQYRNKEDLETRLFSLFRVEETEGVFPLVSKVVFDFFDKLHLRRHHATKKS